MLAIGLAAIRADGPRVIHFPHNTCRRVTAQPIGDLPLRAPRGPLLGQDFPLLDGKMVTVHRKAPGSVSLVNANLRNQPLGCHFFTPVAFQS